MLSRAICTAGSNRTSSIAICSSHVAITLHTLLSPLTGHPIGQTASDILIALILADMVVVGTNNAVAILILDTG